ncbi:MAG: hypothetical protein QM723_34115 [Myxococcaceae bacterium]
MGNIRSGLNGWHYLAALAVAVGLMAGATFYAKHRLQFIQGEPKGAFVTPGHVVLIDRVHIGGRVRSMVDVGGYRVMAIDRKSGQQVAQRIFDDGIGCWAAKANHVWCEQDGKLLNLELPALTTRGDVASVTPGKALVRDRYATTPSGDLQVLFTDGNAAEIDGETLAMNKVAVANFTGATRSGHPFKTVSDLKRPGGGYLRFGDGPKHGLGFAEQNDGAFTPFDNALTFLRKSSSPEFVVTGDPSLVLVSSEASLADDAPKLITRVDDRGEKQLWQATLATRTPSEFLIDGQTAFITTGDRDLRALAIDLESGKTLWRFALPRD